MKSFTGRPFPYRTGMAALLILLLAGCQQSVDDARTLPAAGVVAKRVWTPQLHRDLSAIQTEGVLRIITFPGPPSYLVLNGEETGFEYELAAMFAHEWNLRLETVNARQVRYYRQDELRPDRTGNLSPWDDVIRRTSAAHGLDSLDDLSGMTIHLQAHSPLVELLREIRDQRGLDMRIVTARPRWSEEELLSRVANELITATVTNARSYTAAKVMLPQLRLGPALTETAAQCWVVRRNSPDLRAALDRFLRRHYRPSPDGAKRSQAYGVLEARYFRNARQVRTHARCATTGRTNCAPTARATCPPGTT